MLTKENIDEYSRRVQASNDQKEEPYFNNYEELLKIYTEALLNSGILRTNINKKLIASVLSIVKKADKIQNHLIKYGCVVDTFFIENDIQFVYSCFERFNSIDTIEDVFDIETALRCFINNIEIKISGIERMSDSFSTNRNNALKLLNELKITEKGKYDILHE